MQSNGISCHDVNDKEACFMLFICHSYLAEARTFFLFSSFTEKLSDKDCSH